MSKKTVLLIILGVLFLCCVVSVIVGVIAYNSFAGSITAETSLIKSQNLDYICSVGGDLLEEDVGYFTDSYASTHAFDEAAADIAMVFPSGFNCANLLPNGGKDFLGILMNGQSITLGTENDQTTASLTFKSKDGTTTYTIGFVKVDGTWLIDSIE